MRFDDWRKLPPSIRYRQLKTILRVGLVVGSWVLLAVGLQWAKNPDWAERSALIITAGFVLAQLGYWPF